jgi:hypothetical protein
MTATQEPDTEQQAAHEDEFLDPNPYRMTRTNVALLTATLLVIVGLAAGIIYQLALVSV